MSFETPHNENESGDDAAYKKVLEDLKVLEDTLRKVDQLSEEAREAFAHAFEELGKAASYEDHAFSLKNTIVPSSDKDIDFKEAHIDSVFDYARYKKRSADALTDLSNILFDEAGEVEEEVEELKGRLKENLKRLQN